VNEPLSETKKGLKWWIFNRFGPPEVVNLINHIDQITQDGQFDIAIYPMGNFPFTVRTSAENHQQEPYVFNTPQERAAFQAGLGLGVNLCGATAQILDEDQAQALDLMQKKATHNGGGTRDN